MAFLTKVEFRTRIARLLGESPDVQALDAEDAKPIDDAIDDVVAEYRQRRFIAFDATAVPDYAANALADLIVLRLTTVFSVPQEILLRIGGREAAEKALLDVTKNGDALSQSVHPFGFAKGSLCRKYP